MHEPAITQYIYIEQGAQRWVAWDSLKMDYDQFGEMLGRLNGRPIALDCELTAPVCHHFFGAGASFHGLAILRGVNERPFE